MKSVSEGVVVTTLLATASVLPVAVAADLPKEGSYDFVSCWSGASNVIQYSKMHRATSYEMTGMNRSNPPGGLFDNTSFRCVGTNASFDGKPTSSTVCETVDADGHKRLTYFSQGADGKMVRQDVAGTGKYEGLATSGTVTTLGPFPTVKDGTFHGCNRQTGTYKMK